MSLVLLKLLHNIIAGIYCHMVKYKNMKHSMNKVKNLRDDWIKDTNNLTKIQFRQFFMTIWNVWRD